MQFHYTINLEGNTCRIAMFDQLIDPYQIEELIIELESYIHNGIIFFELDLHGITYFNDSAMEIFSSILNMARTAGGDCKLTGVRKVQSKEENIQKLQTIFGNTITA